MADLRSTTVFGDLEVKQAVRALTGVETEAGLAATDSSGATGAEITGDGSGSYVGANGGTLVVQSGLNMSGGTVEDASKIGDSGQGNYISFAAQSGAVLVQDGTGSNEQLIAEDLQVAAESTWLSNHITDGSAHHTRYADSEAKSAVVASDVGLGSVENIALSAATWADIGISTSDISPSDIGLSSELSSTDVSGLGFTVGSGLVGGSGGEALSLDESYSATWTSSQEFAGGVVVAGQADTGDGTGTELLSIKRTGKARTDPFLVLHDEGGSGLDWRLKGDHTYVDTQKTTFTGQVGVQGQLSVGKIISNGGKLMDASQSTTMVGWGQGQDLVLRPYDSTYDVRLEGAANANGNDLKDTTSSQTIWDASAGHVPSAAVESAGLDADTLDGDEASDLVHASGDTMGGALQMQGNAIKFSDGQILGNGSGALKVVAADGTDTGELIVDTLTTSGSVNEKSSTELAVEDRFIEVASSRTGTPTSGAGLRVGRGSSDDALIMFNESAGELGTKIGTSSFARLVVDDGRTYGINISGDADTIDGVQLADITFGDIAASRYTDSEAQSAVSASDVGLGSVENVALSTATWSDMGISKTDVSASNVGLGSVPNLDPRAGFDLGSSKLQFTSDLAVSEDSAGGELMVGDGSGSYAAVRTSDVHLTGSSTSLSTHVGATDSHHSRYTDTEAVSAIESHGNALSADISGDAQSLQGYVPSDMLNAQANVGTFTSTDTSTDLNTDSWTKVKWNVQLDVDTGYTHDPSGNPTDITVDNAGRYRVKAMITYDSDTNRVNPGVQIFVNGTAQGGIGLSGYVRLSNDHDQASNYVEETLSLNSGDTITVQTKKYANNGTATLRGGESRLVVDQKDSSVSTTSDADTVDGKDAAAFLLAGGDTLQGALDTGGNDLTDSTSSQTIYDASAGHVPASAVQKSGLNADKLDGTSKGNLSWADMAISKADVSASNVGLGSVLNVAQVENAGSTPSIQSGTSGNRPSAGTAGRLFVETDNQRLVRDTGSSWEVLGISTVNESDLGFDTATQSELDTHAGTSSAHHSKYTDSEAKNAVTASDVGLGSVPNTNFESGFTTSGQITMTGGSPLQFNALGSSSNKAYFHGADGSGDDMVQIIRDGNNNYRWNFSGGVEVGGSKMDWADLGISRSDVSKSDVGLGSVPNTNIAYSSTIAADAFTSTEVSNLRSGKLDNGNTPWTSNNYFDGSDARSAVSASDVGLGNVENVALSTATWADMGISQSDVTKSDVGLGNLSNTDYWTIEEGDGEQTNIYSGQKLEIYGGRDLHTEVTSTGGESRLRVSHANTSSQGNVHTGGATVIDDIDTDSSGHITNMNTENRSLDDWQSANSDVDMGGNDINNVGNFNIEHNSATNSLDFVYTG